MNMAGNLWWCSLLSLLFIINQGTPVWSQGFELSSFSEVVNNAMHLYGPPVPSDVSGHNIPPLTSGNSQVRLFPCMNFTCDGVITKLMFVAPVEVDETVTVTWPVFGLWRKRNCGQFFCRWEEVQRQWLFNIPTNEYPGLVNSSNAVRVYELELSIPFEQGDILGIRQYGDATQQRSLPYQNGGAYCNTLISDYYTVTESSRTYTLTSRDSSRDQIVPYIAVETDDFSSACAVGFLNRESLDLIVDAPQNNTIFGYLNFTQNNVQSMPLNVSGSLINFIIAAKFNHTERSGWPILQIRRRGNVTAMTQSEPRPTGYLNVFVYTLSVDVQPEDVLSIHIPESNGQRYLLAYLSRSSVSKPLVHANISIDSTTVTTPESVTVSDRPISHNDGTTVSTPGTTTVTTPETVTVSDRPVSSNDGTTVSTLGTTTVTTPETVTVSDGPVSSNDGTTVSTLGTTTAYAANSPTTNPPNRYTSTTTNLVSSTASATSEDYTTTSLTYSEPTVIISDSSSKRQPVTGIIGGVLGTLAVLILLAVFIIIIVFLTYRHKRSSKHFLSSTDAITVPANNRLDALDNVTYAPDSILPDSDQMMLSTRGGEGDGTGTTGSGAVAISSSQNNPQEDYYYYKLYEWGVFVPTVNQREAVTEAFTKTSDVDTLYSTLGESQYSTLSQLNQTPEFFDESEDYWVPASDEKSLYEQLSRKKYREIHKNQIQYGIIISSSYNFCFLWPKLKCNK